MAREIFEYTKIVLNKVSFDKNLFCRELQKASRHLLPYEIEELRVWLLSLTTKKPELDTCLVYIDAPEKKIL